MMDLRLVESTERPRPPFTRRTTRGAIRTARVLPVVALLLAPTPTLAADSHEFDDIHFHLTYRDLYFDNSWDEVAKYAVSSPEATEKTAALLNRYPDEVFSSAPTPSLRRGKSRTMPCSPCGSRCSIG